MTEALASLSTALRAAPPTPQTLLDPLRLVAAALDATDCSICGVCPIWSISPPSPDVADAPDAPDVADEPDPTLRAAAGLGALLGTVLGMPPNEWTGSASELPSPLRDAMSVTVTASVALTPIPIEQDDWWVLVVYDDRSDRTWSAADRAALDTVSSLLGFALAYQRAALHGRQYQDLIEHVPAVLYIDEATAPGLRRYPTVYVGPQVEAILGIKREDWVENDELWQARIHPDDWEWASAEYDDYLARDGTLVQEYRIVRPDDGRIVWVRDDCAIVTDDATGRRLVQGVMLDVTAQKILESQLRAAEAKNLALIDQMPGVVTISPLGANPEPAFVSASVESVLGVSRDEWLDGDWWSDHIHPDDRDRVLDGRDHLLAGTGDEALRTEYRMMTDDEREIWIGEVSQVVRNGDRPWMLQSFLADITTQKRAEEQLEFRASHDALTGLANRSLFEEHLERALARASRQDLAVAVLFVDVDDFKLVNDTYGHDAGDETLRTLARRLVRCVRDSDLVARRGGDEFLVLLPDIEPDAHEAVDLHIGPERPPRGRLVSDAVIERIKTSARFPIELANGEVSAHLSIGSSVYPFDAHDARSIMASADAAMYRAKQALQVGQDEADDRGELRDFRHA